MLCLKGETCFTFSSRDFFSIHLNYSFIFFQILKNYLKEQKSPNDTVCMHVWHFNICNLFYISKMEIKWIISNKFQLKNKKPNSICVLNWIWLIFFFFQLMTNVTIIKLNQKASFLKLHLTPLIMQLTAHATYGTEWR